MASALADAAEWPPRARRHHRWSVMNFATEINNELHLRRRLKRLWRLGPRPFTELLLETATISGRTTWLDKRLDDYLAIGPELLHAASANDWPNTVPLVVIEGDRQ
jgi:hypothetical protein